MIDFQTPPILALMVTSLAGSDSVTVPEMVILEPFMEILSALLLVIVRLGAAKAGAASEKEQKAKAKLNIIDEVIFFILSLMLLAIFIVSFN